MRLDVDIYLKQGRFLLDARFKCFESALGVFGPSGCGKSTLFRAIAGLARPDGGRIELDGTTLFDAGRRIFVPPRKRNIALAFQDARLFPHWSVERNLRAGERLKRRIADRPFGFDDIVDLLDIGHLIGRAVDDLSGGEKQRVAIGRALLSNPRLLLLDEPVTGLDVSLKARVLPFLAKVHQSLRIPMILISHDLGEILQLTDQLLLARDGAIVGQGPLHKLARDPQTLSELGGADLTNLIQAKVRRHAPSRGATELSLPSAPDHHIETELLHGLAPGAAAHIGIAANQIALATKRPTAISMRNQLPARVVGIVHAPDRSICHLDTAAGRLFAEVTPGTEHDMGLAPGTEVWALFKSMAARRL